MVVTIAASWKVTSRRKYARVIAFWLFLLSNVLWVAWGWHTKAYALIVLQFCLAFFNIRGARKNAEDAGGEGRAG